MIEKTILEYLNDRLPVPAYMEEPDTKSVEYVILEKTALSDTNHIQQSTFAIQAYAGTLYDAAILSGRVKHWMREAADNIAEISRCKLNAEYNFTDTQTKRYRYQSVWNITHYEEEN